MSSEPPDTRPACSAPRRAPAPSQARSPRPRAAVATRARKPGPAPTSAACRRPRCSRHRERHRLVEVSRPSGADDAPAHGRVGHQRRAFGDPMQRREVLPDACRLDLAHEVPDGRRRRHDVRLIAAVDDDVVRALRRVQMLAAEVPRHVHELDGVQRAAAAPRHHGAVRRVPSNEYSADTRPVPSDCPSCAEPRATCVNSTASTPSNRPSRTNQAFAASSSSATPGHKTIVPGNPLALHDLFHRERRDDVHGLPRVVPFAMPWRSFDHAARDTRRPAPATPSECRRCRSRARSRARRSPRSPTMTTACRRRPFRRRSRSS